MTPAVKLSAVVLGALFGFLISWGQFVSPDRIREMLLLEDPYLYLMMFSAMAVGLVGLRLLRRAGRRALFTGEPIGWLTERPRRNHVVGAAIFGAGWALADSCPAPIAGQLAQGVGWSLFTIAGVLIGIELYLRRAEVSTVIGEHRKSPSILFR
jgi:uncharacterized membrane protein YedE/YeeE